MLKLLTVCLVDHATDKYTRLQENRPDAILTSSFVWDFLRNCKAIFATEELEQLSCSRGTATVLY